MTALNRPARLAVGIISAGRVGSVFGNALRRAGHNIRAVSAVSNQSLRRADELLPDVPIAAPPEVAQLADLVVLAVPDDVLPGLVRGLAATSSLRAGQIVMHTSGAHGMEVLAPAREIGALGIASHPVMTFTGRAEDVQRLSASVVGITTAAPVDSDDVAWQVAESLVVEIGAEPVRVPNNVRPLYHAALAHGANHLITLVADCADVLRSAGITDPERMLAPLLSAALDNSLRYGGRALTGPVARGDGHTVSRHMNVIADQAPEILPAYLALSKRTADRAVADGLLKSDAAEKIRDVLGGQQ